MDRDRLKLGVVGYGSAGSRHVAAAERSDLVELIGIAESHPEALARYRGAAARVASLDALLDLRPDAVVVALPHGLLAEAALRVIAAGRYLLLEKPVATRLDDARAVVAAARDAGVGAMVNFNHRFREEYRRAHALIAEGAIGAPTLLSVRMVSAIGPLPRWIWDREVAGGGMMLYNGVHTLDHLAWLAGSPIVAAGAAQAAHHYPDSDGLEDTAIAHLRFASGALGSLVQLKTASPDTLAGWETEVHGARGSVRIRTGVGLAWRTPEGEGERTTRDTDRYLATLEAFASALLEGRAPPVGLEAGVAALAVAHAMTRSSDEGRTVAVEAV